MKKKKRRMEFNQGHQWAVWSSAGVVAGATMKNPLAMPVLGFGGLFIGRSIDKWQYKERMKSKTRRKRK